LLSPGLPSNSTVHDIYLRLKAADEHSKMSQGEFSTIYKESDL